MPIAIEPKTFANIKEAVRARAKIASDDTDTLAAIEGFINQRYANICTESHWRWLKSKRDLRIPDEYTTGTLTVTIDSRDVTGAGTTWSEDFIGRFIKISGEDSIYEIVGRSSNTSIRLSERIVRASAGSLTYSIYQSEFGLWPDLENIDEIWHEYGGLKRTVQAITPREYWELVRANPGRSGKTEYYTRDGLKGYEGVPIGEFVIGYDFVGSPDCPRLLLYPRIPDDDYTLHVSYVKKAQGLANSADEPLMPLNDRWVLVYGALADYYSLAGNETSMAYWGNEFEKGLKRMLRDNEDTDNKAKLIVNDVWRAKRPSAGRYDLGSYFDRYY